MLELLPGQTITVSTTFFEVPDVPKSTLVLVIGIFIIYPTVTLLSPQLSIKTLKPFLNSSIQN